jgi:hypothetical protein
MGKNIEDEINKLKARYNQLEGYINGNKILSDKEMQLIFDEQAAIKDKLDKYSRLVKEITPVAGAKTIGQQTNAHRNRYRKSTSSGFFNI